MRDSLTITCGPTDDRNRRRVVVTFGDLSHVDLFNVDQQFQRSKWRDAVVGKFGLTDDAHEFLDTEVLRVAAAQDESGGDVWQPITTNLSDVKSAVPDFLWSGRMASNTLTCVDGDGGVGKGLMMMDLAARGSRGDTMPPGSAPDGTFEPWSTLFITSEDAPDFILRPRAEAAGANLERIVTMSSVEIPDEDKRTVALLQDIELIERVVSDNEVRLTVIDPYSEFIDANLNMNSDPDNRKCLGPLAEMAQRTDCAIVIVRHMNKKEGQSAQYRGVGSTAPLNASRAAYVIAPDPEDPDLRVIACTKFNIGPKPQSLRFRIEQAGTTARVRWEGECDLTAAELVKTQKQSGGGKLEQAKDIIADVLASGSRGSNEVMQACQDAGIGVSTYHTARKAIGVMAEKTEFQGQWLLTMPSRNGDSF